MKQFTMHAVLKTLRNSAEYISGEDLSQIFQMSRTAIWKYIHALRKEGYEIDSIPNKGYKFLSRPDIVTPQAIQNHLQTKFLGKEIYYFETTDSTNNEAKKYAHKGAKNGSLFICNYQTAGKGRLGRSWSDYPNSNICFSILLRPSIAEIHIPTLTLLVGLAVCQSLSKRPIQVSLKWPNDIVIRNKKVCGILTEISTEVNCIHYVVIGIGINVKKQNFPLELQSKATLLEQERYPNLHRATIIQEILCKIERLLQTDTNTMLQEYKKYCISLDRQVHFSHQGNLKTGKTIDIGEEGELLVLCEDGIIYPVNIGEAPIQDIYE